MKNTKLVLLLIFILACILRFYQLGEVPLGFHRDEAFLAYNAYSILKTGMDMSGNIFPLHLESFLYSPSGYAYFSIPFISIFGLSEFSARFASALFGSLTVLSTFLLVTELFFKHKEKHLIALIASFFIAISPWNIILSRTSTENVIVVFFISLATYLFLLFVRKNKNWLFFLSMFFFFLTLFVYQAPRSFLPLFIPVMLVIYFYKKINFKKSMLIILTYAVLIVLPVLYVVVSPTLSLRLRTLSVFYSDATRAYLSQSYINDGMANIPLTETRIFHNKLTGYFMQISKNYFGHLSYDFMFTDSYFPDRYRIPNSGLLYLYDLPLILLGLWEILKRKEKAGMLLIIWVLLAPGGSSLAFDDIPNMQRTLLFFPALSIISALGFTTLLNYLKRKELFLLIFSLVVCYGLVAFLHLYFIDARFYRLWYRQEGYKEMVSKVNSLLPNYKYAVITERESAPAIFFLFYSKYNPASFQSETKFTDKTQTDGVNFGKYVFDKNECPIRNVLQTSGQKNVIGKSGVLYVESGYCKSEDDISYLNEIKRADDSIAFRIAIINKGSK